MGEKANRFGDGLRGSGGGDAKGDARDDDRGTTVKNGDGVMMGRGGDGGGHLDGDGVEETARPGSVKVNGRINSSSSARKHPVGSHVAGSVGDDVTAGSVQEKMTPEKSRAHGSSHSGPVSSPHHSHRGSRQHMHSGHQDMSGREEGKQEKQTKQTKKQEQQEKKKNDKKKPRIKSSGGFLLDSMPFSNTLRNASGFRLRSRGSEIKQKKKKEIIGAEVDQKKDVGDEKVAGQGRLDTAVDEKASVNTGNQGDEQSQRTGYRFGDNEAEGSQAITSRNQSQDQRYPQTQSQHPPTAQINPADIVNMALSLSESRRRQVSGGSLYMGTPSPPPPMMSGARNFSPVGFAPLGSSHQHSFRDYSAGGSLRLQLQQQRRVSRNASPVMPRRASGFRLSSMTQPADLSGSALLRQNESTGQNHQFSAATLARADKARNYIELGVEYRRLLRLLPPLQKPSSELYSATSNSSRNPISAVTAAAGFARRSGELSRVPTTEDGSTNAEADRAYNPLQAIRNRRVRIRERQALNPDIETWNDIRRVRPWVDEVDDTRAFANSPYHNRNRSLLPDFGIMDYELHHHITGNSLSSPGKHSRDNSIKKPRRQRMDWSVSPAELFADTYWLEQDNHKTLIEDRNGDRVVAVVAAASDRERVENNSSRPSREYRQRDAARGRPGFSNLHQATTSSDFSTVEGFGNDSDVSERVGGAAGGAGSKRHHLRKRPGLQGRFTRDGPLRRARSTSGSSSDEAHIRVGKRKRAGGVPLSHLDNTGPLERHMIMMMKEEEEEERRKMEAEENMDEKAEWSAADSTDRGGDVKNTLSSTVTRQSTMQSTAESVGGGGSSGVDKHLELPSKKTRKDLRLIQTVTNSRAANKLGLMPSKDQQSAGPVSPTNANFGAFFPDHSSSAQVSRVRSLPVDHHHHHQQQQQQQQQNKSRLPRLPHLDILTKGFSHPQEEATRTRPSSREKDYHDNNSHSRRRNSDATSLSDQDHENGAGEAEKSPIMESIKRVGSLKRGDGRAGNDHSGVSAGVFDSKIRQGGRNTRENGSAVGRFLHKRKERLGGLVRHDGGKINYLGRRHDEHGDEDDHDDGGGVEDDYVEEDRHGYRDAEGDGTGKGRSKRRGLGIGMINETPDTSQSDGEALYTTRVRTSESDGRRERAGRVAGSEGSAVPQKPLPTFRHTRRDLTDTTSPDGPQMGLYNGNLPSFKPTGAPRSRDGRRTENEDDSKRPYEKLGRLAPPPAPSNRLDLAKTVSAESRRSGGSRYSSQADSAIASARDRSRDSRDALDTAAADFTAAELSRSNTRQSSARLNAALAIPGSLGSGGLMPMTGLANIRASKLREDGYGRAVSRDRSYGAGVSRSRSRSRSQSRIRSRSRSRSRSRGLDGDLEQDRSVSQTRAVRWSSCNVVMPDGTRCFSIAVAARTLSRTETLLVSSGVKAMEIVRRAYAVQDPPSALLVEVAVEVRRLQLQRHQEDSKDVDVDVDVNVDVPREIGRAHV